MFCCRFKAWIWYYIICYIYYIYTASFSWLNNTVFHSNISRSNCVVCLCPDKRAVLQQAYNVLKVSLENFYQLDEKKRCNIGFLALTVSYLHFIQEGGELYFSDMYASKVVPDHMTQDPVLWGKITLYYLLVKKKIIIPAAQICKVMLMCNVMPLFGL